MTITADNLIDPKGLIQPAMFPALDQDHLIGRVSGWLDEARVRAITITDEGLFDIAVENYVYWRAFDAVYIRLAAQPSTITLQSQGGQTYSNAQIMSFSDRAKSYENTFKTILQDFTTSETPVTPPVKFPPSGSVTNVFGY